MDGDFVIARSSRCKLIAASAARQAELAEALEVSREPHKPWMYHGNAEAYFHRLNKGRTIGFFVIDTTDDALACVINLNEPVGGGFASAYLGYFTVATKMRCGLMKEGLAQVLDYAFFCLNFHRMEANIQPANIASAELVKSLGFRLEGFSPKYLKIGGEWRDHDRYAILAEEWTPSRPRPEYLERLKVAYSD